MTSPLTFFPLLDPITELQRIASMETFFNESLADDISDQERRNYENALARLRHQRQQIKDAS